MSAGDRLPNDAEEERHGSPHMSNTNPENVSMK